jgi:hypothetical protein
MLMTRDIASFRKEVACPKMNAGAGARAVLRIFLVMICYRERQAGRNLKKIFVK